MDQNGGVFDEQEEKRLLGKFMRRRLVEGENLLEVQRQHSITIVFKFAFLLFLSLSLIGFSLFEFQYRSNLPLWITDFYNSKFIIGLSMIVLSIFSTFGAYIFMRWYYQFYIITNKRLMHIHFFRLMGFYEEEIFFEKVTTERIDRNTDNILYDLLGIEDVYVYMLTIESVEPFIFRSPQNAQVIESILDQVITPTRNNNSAGLVRRGR